MLNLSTLCENIKTKSMMIQFEDGKKYYNIFVMQRNDGEDLDTLILKIKDKYYSPTVNKEEYEKLLMKMWEYDNINNYVKNKMKEYFDKVGIETIKQY